jgi:hypothetical protein
MVNMMYQQERGDNMTFTFTVTKSDLMAALAAIFTATVLASAIILPVM